jgi:hypothetical protein
MIVQRFSLIHAATCLLAVSLLTTHAAGQTQDEAPNAQTRNRLAEALRLLKADKPAAACPMLEEIVTSAPQYSAAKLSLADCYVQVGKLVSATRLYSILEQEASDRGQDTARRIAANKRVAIESRISHVRVIVPEILQTAKDLIILRDGERLVSAQWGVAMPVDRGPHTIEARLPGETPWKKDVDVWQDSAIVDISVDLPLPYRPEKPSTSTKPKDATVSPIVPIKQSGKEPWSNARVIGFSTAGLGLLGLSIGLGFGAAAISTNNESNAEHCDAETNYCDNTGLALRDKTLLLGNISTGVVIAGSVLAIGGLTVFFTSTAKKKIPTTFVGFGPASVSVNGRF